MISPVRESKKSSIVSDTRSLLSIILLYFFIKSIFEVGRGGRGRAGKGGLSDPFDQQKSHRFKEAIKVTFQDVVGMQKAK